MDTETSAGYPPDTVAVAIEQLASPDWPVRLEAVDALHALADEGLEPREQKAARAALLPLLTDGSWKVRQSLASALGALPLSGPVRDALTALSSDENRYVREAATRALHQKQNRVGNRRRVTHESDPVFQAIRAEIKRLGTGLPSLSESALYEIAERIADVAYRAVAADATHELNTVLATIDGFADQLVKRMDSLNVGDEQVALSVSRLKERTNFARRIGEDLRWYASPGAEVLEEVSAETLLREAISLAQERAHRSGSPVSVRVPDIPDIKLAVARSRLVRALGNIICNGLEAAPVSQVVLGVEIGPGAVCFVIEDDGCGMTDDQLVVATRCFTTNKRPTGGTGMGLAIAQRVVEGEHRGRLEIASAVDEGTRVKIILPLMSEEKDELGV